MLYNPNNFFESGETVNPRLLFYLMGQGSILCGLLMFVPFVYSLIHQTAEFPAFVASVILTMTIGEVLLRLGKKHPNVMNLQDAAAFAVVIWIFFSILGMFPYFFTGRISFINALFESVSNLTTTGITFLPEDQFYALHLWGSLMGWVGGMSFVVFIVTILPQVSADYGIALAFPKNFIFHFSPLFIRLKKMAQQILNVYFAFTLISAVLYFFSGLGFWDSILMAMLTISTSGSPTDMTFIAQNNIWLELSAMVTMLFSCMNFLLVWMLFREKKMRNIFHDIFHDFEFKLFLSAVCFFSLLFAFHLYYLDLYGFWDSVRYGFFTIISFMSTNGFLATPLEHWPHFERALLSFLVIIGGCLGSATGGFKIRRMFILWRATGKAIFSQLHPHMITQVKVGEIPVPRSRILPMFSFFFLYAFTAYLFTMFLCLSGVPMVEASGIALGLLSGIGSSGLYAPEIFVTLPIVVKFFCCFFMILGRVEIFALLLLLPSLFAKKEKKW